MNTREYITSVAQVHGFNFIEVNHYIDDGEDRYTYYYCHSFCPDPECVAIFKIKYK